MLSPWPTVIDLFQIEVISMSENTFTSWESSLRFLGSGSGANSVYGRLGSRLERGPATVQG